LSNIKSESLVWLDNLAALGAQLQKTPSATHAQLADALNLKRPYVSLLLALQPILDPTAIEKVRLAASPKSGISSHSGTQAATISFTLSFNCAKALIPLGKTADPSKAVHSALDTILSQRLAPKHIAALVDELMNGKPAETFDPKAKRPKPLRKVQDKPGRHVSNNDDDYEGSATWALLNYLVEVGVKPTDLRGVYFELMDFQSRSKDKTTYLKELRVYLENMFEHYGVNIKIK